jgi:hypothetical protein
MVDEVVLEVSKVNVAEVEIAEVEEACHGYNLGGPKHKWCGLTDGGGHTTGARDIRKLMP